VFDRFGDVVGIVVSKIRDGEQLNFALSIRSLLANLVGVPLADVFRLDRGLSLLNPDVRRAATISTSTLLGMTTIGLVLEDLPQAAQKTVTLEEAAGWARAELARAAPSLRVRVGEPKAVAEGDTLPTDLVTLLSFLDNRSAVLRISIGLSWSPDARVGWYSAQADVARVAVLGSGLSTVRVWQNAYYGVFGDEARTKDQVRELITTLVREFADQWVRENGSLRPGSDAPRPPGMSMGR